MQEEAAALQECLFALGIVTREKLQVHLHRRRFERVRSQFPPSAADRLTWASVLFEPSLARAVAGFSDLRAMRALLSASPSARRVATDAMPAVTLGTGTLGSIFVCGGKNGSSCNVQPLERPGPGPGSKIR
jgi:hypothetical protein